MLRPADSVTAPPPAPSPDPESAPSWVRIGGCLALAALALVTVPYPSTSRILGWPLAAVVAALWAFPIVGIGLLGARGVSWRFPPRLVLAGVIVLVTGATVSALASPFHAASLPRLWPTLGGAALYLWLHHAWSGRAAANFAALQNVARGLALAGVLLAGVSFYQWAEGPWHQWTLQRNTAPFGHSTYTGGAMVLFLPWTLLQAWLSRGLVRFAWLAGSGLVLFVIATTSSRGAVLALGFTGLIGTVSLLVASGWSWPRKLLFAGGVIAVGAIAVGSNPRLRELIVHRQWGETARESNTQRTAMLGAGVRLGAQRPWLGWGPGTVPLTYPKVRAELDGGVENVLQLHNTPVQLWATMGATGLAALVLLLGGGLVALVRMPRHATAFAAAASVIGYGVVALTDHQLDVPVITGAMAAGFAVLTAFVYPSRSPTPASSGRLLGPLACAGLLAATLGPTVRDLQARRCYDQALDALARGQNAEYIHALERAAQATPGDPFFSHRIAGWLLDQRAATADPARQADLARQAAELLAASLASDAHLEFAHFNLGWLALDLHQPRDAIRHFRQAARFVPDKGGVYFGLGLAYLAEGNRESARRAFALEIVNDPRTLSAPVWELPEFSALMPAVRVETLRLFRELETQWAEARVVAEWTRWWSGEDVPPSSLEPGFNAASRRFVVALPLIMRAESLPPDTPASNWLNAYRAWLGGRRTPGPSDPAAFLTTAGGDRDFAAALARRAGRHRDDFRAFLRAPAGDDAGCVRTYRRERIGYGVLALHPEGPPLADLYVVQENRVATAVAAGLFPAKGWLPGHFLLALLPPEPR